MLLPQMGEFCSLWCSLAASLSVLQMAQGKAEDGSGLRTSAFQFLHAMRLLPLCFLNLSLLSQPSPCSWFLASLQLFPVTSPLMQTRGKTLNPKHAWF